MKRVYLKGYLYFNLGDDLFFQIIANRYKNVKFISLTKFDYNIAKNIKFINYNKIKFVDRLIKLFSLKNKSVESLLIRKSDIVVLIGGSMFIENSSTYPKDLFSKSKKYYILGSNFGPYKTDLFFNKYKNIFSNAHDVCFRDRYSFNLFKELPNVRTASDIVFSLDFDNINIINEKRVIISVIDVSKRFGNDVKCEYIKKIVDFIKLFTEKKYFITLMSFCKYEGDENMINDILSCTDEKVDTYFYNGNIKEALEILEKSQVIVGTRFHANILGLVMKKTIIPIAYSDKTINTLNDIGFDGKIFDIRDMDNFDVFSINDDDLNYKVDVSSKKDDAKRHFMELDKILNMDNN